MLAYDTQIRIFCRYTRQETYDVVARVDKYSRFLPFCTGSRILSRANCPSPSGDASATKLLAELTVSFMSITESYSSDVVCVPYSSVEVSIALLIASLHALIPP